MKQQVRHEASSAGDRREIGSRLAEIEARLGKMSGDESEIKRDERVSEASNSKYQVCIKLEARSWREVTIE